VLFLRAESLSGISAARHIVAARNVVQSDSIFVELFVSSTDDFKSRFRGGAANQLGKSPPVDLCLIPVFLEMFKQQLSLHFSKSDLELVQAQVEAVDRNGVIDFGDKSVDHARKVQRTGLVQVLFNFKDYGFCAQLAFSLHLLRLCFVCGKSKLPKVAGVDLLVHVISYQGALRLIK
jgi:hypothetical protein